MKATWKSTLLWSVIAAAFVGPGTVTTATKAGSEGGWYYIIPLIIAMLAGYLLMEMVARLTLVTQQPLGKIVGKTLGKTAVYLLFVSVLLGCAAYQAGNLLGGFAGLNLFAELPSKGVLIMAVAAGFILWLGSMNRISKVLAGVVVLMGVAFLYTGLSVSFDSVEVGNSPNYSLKTATVLALIGTTIVPYNFFLAAGLSQRQNLDEMRSGLLTSFIIGGLITLGILLTGTALGSFTSFTDLAGVLTNEIGIIGGSLLGFGLFAAGFSSAITAPLAAAVAGRTLLASEEDSTAWSNTGKWFRLIWLAVLGMGALVASLELDIIPVILAAQVVNGLLVPFLAALVIYLCNQRNLLGDQVNTNWQNVGGLVVFAYITYQSIFKLSSLSGIEFSQAVVVLLTASLVAGLEYLVLEGRAK